MIFIKRYYQGDMDAIRRLKRLEIIAKSAPALAILATLALGQLAHAAQPNEICWGDFCIRICGSIGPIKICL